MTIIRNITIEAQKYLKEAEILLFIGARQAGKTTILKQLQQYLEKQNQFCYFLNLEDPEYLELLNKSPKNLFKIFTLDLKKRNYIFIDEVQYLKNPSNFLKYLYDEYKDKIKLLVSGSSAFYLDKKFKDSLAGRKKIFNVFTLSFPEFLRFKNENELSRRLTAKTELSLADKEKITLYFQEYLLYGGYPRVVLAPLEEKKDILREIAYSYIKKDIYESNIRQDEIFYRLFKILASQIGNLVNISELANTLGISKTSVDNYLYVMQKSFHIHLIKPFYKNIRKELSKMPKIYFYDVGLRNFFIDNFKSYELREDKGPLLENISFRQLIEKYDIETIKFWRTITKQEIDFVIGENLAFEVKVQPQKFRVKNCRLFLENYPKIKLQIISLNSEQKSVNGYPVLEVWKI